MGDQEKEYTTVRIYKKDSDKIKRISSKNKTISDVIKLLLERIEE